MKITNLPNHLTILRILLVPVFVALFYFEGEQARVISTIIFIVAALTDWLDGYLARKFEVTSSFGAFLDPVADKIMVSVCLILLVDHNPTQFSGVFMSIAAAIIIGREIAISALREWMSAQGKRSSVAVSMIGKIKTGAQMGALGCLIYADDFLGLPLVAIGFAALWLAVILTLWSMIDYIMNALPKLNHSSSDD